MNVTHHFNQRKDRNDDSGSALIMVIVLSAIIYLAVTVLLLMITVETHVSYSEQRSMQALFGAESFLTLGVADGRALNGEWRNSVHEQITFGDELTIFYTRVAGNDKVDTHQKRSLYCGEHRGTAAVYGPNGLTKRQVWESVRIKPFALFAEKGVSLQTGVKIVGHSNDTKANVHGNTHVYLASGVSVDGNVTSNGEIRCAMSAACPENSANGKIQSDCRLSVPQIAERLYYQRYMYQGKVYEAEPLGTPERIPLIPKEEDGQTPAQAVHCYVRRPSAGKNPAGVFFADATINDETSNTLTNFDIEGTLILRGAGEWNIKGIVKIDAVEQFPAILKFSDEPLSLTYIPFATIQPFLSERGGDMNQTNHISGLIYSTGNVALASNGVGGELLNGSVFAQNITISSDLQFLMRYNLRLLTDSPPGLQLVERFNWREKIGD